MPVEYADIGSLAHPAHDLTTPGTLLTVAGWGTTSSGGPSSDEAMEVEARMCGNVRAEEAELTARWEDEKAAADHVLDIRRELAEARLAGDGAKVQDRASKAQAAREEELRREAEEP